MSNLNRQFLFQKQHISKSKAHVRSHSLARSPACVLHRLTTIHSRNQKQVARESALKFNPRVEIISYHANIMEPQFGLMWFKSFDLVLNALDNVGALTSFCSLETSINLNRTRESAARRYVNKMCIAANVPLCESGTEGYLGQCTVHYVRPISTLFYSQRPDVETL